MITPLVIGLKLSSVKLAVNLIVLLISILFGKASNRIILVLIFPKL